MKKKILFPLIGVPLLGLGLLLTSCEPQVRYADVIDDRVHLAVLTGEGFHDGEAYMPMGFLVNQGARITVIGPEVGTVTAYNSDFSIDIEKSVADVSVDDFDALILPGGRAPAMLRENEKVISFARDFFNSGKTVAAICHGPQVLITAGVMDGIDATGFGGIEEELVEAGAIYHDEEVVIHDNLITSRTPPDLFAFSKAIKQSVMIQPTIEEVPPRPSL